MSQSVSKFSLTLGVISKESYKFLDGYSFAVTAYS